MSLSPLSLVLALYSVAVHVPSTLSAAIPDTSYPVMPRQTNGTKHNVIPPLGVKKVYSEKLCDTIEKEIEAAAWTEASQYAQALASWRVNSSFQSTMDLYMGNDSRGPLGDILKGGTFM